VRTLTTELFDIPVLGYEDGNMEYQDMHVESNLDKLKHFWSYSINISLLVLSYSC